MFVSSVEGQKGLTNSHLYEYSYTPLPLSGRYIHVPVRKFTDLILCCLFAGGDSLLKVAGSQDLVQAARH
jgi:hypothetical protein